MNYTRHDLEVAWAAGLFEGEGSLSPNVFSRSGRDGQRRNARMRVQLQISSTDEDVILRFREIVGVGNVNGPYWHSKSTKPIWQFRLMHLPEIHRIVECFWPFLSSRRRERITEVLREKRAADAAYKPRPRGPRPGPALLSGQLKL